MDLVLPAEAEADAADDQQHPKNIKHPMEAGDQSYARANENAAQDECADDAPEQNPMLLLLGYREKIEDDQEYEEVIGAERHFQNIAGDEFERDLVPLPKVKNDGEPSREYHVGRAPGQGYPKA